jgi:membrane protein DedA with SNARE-associated domain
MFKRQISNIVWLNFLTNYFILLGEHYGYLTLFVGMFLESLGIPFMGLAAEVSTAYLITEGRMSIYLAILVAGVGNTLGSALSWWLGYKFGNWFRKRRKDNEKTKERDAKLTGYIKKYGAPTIFFAQLFGVTRTFISFPAGFLKMDFKKFIAYTLAGGLIYSFASVMLSFVWRRVYDTLVYPAIGLSFASLAVIVIIGYVVTHLSIHFGKKAHAKIKEYQDGQNNGD